MMEALSYVVGSLAWSIFGFAAGMYVVTVQREVHEIKATVVDEAGHAPAERWRHAGEAYEHARRRFGILILVLAFVSLLQITVTAIGYNQQIDCQNRVNRHLREDALTRAARSSEDWATIRTLLTAVENAEDEGEWRQALADANDALAASKPAAGQAYIADEC